MNKEFWQGFYEGLEEGWFRAKEGYEMDRYGIFFKYSTDKEYKNFLNPDDSSARVVLKERRNYD